MAKEKVTWAQALKEITKDQRAGFKERLTQAGLSPSTIKAVAGRLNVSLAVAAKELMAKTARATEALEWVVAHTPSGASAAIEGGKAAPTQARLIGRGKSLLQQELDPTVAAAAARTAGRPVTPAGSMIGLWEPPRQRVRGMWRPGMPSATPQDRPTAAVKVSGSQTIGEAEPELSGMRNWLKKLSTKRQSLKEFRTTLPKVLGQMGLDPEAPELQSAFFDRTDLDARRRLKSLHTQFNKLGKTVGRQGGGATIVGPALIGTHMQAAGLQVKSLLKADTTARGAALWDRVGRIIEGKEKIPLKGLPAVPKTPSTFSGKGLMRLAVKHPALSIPLGIMGASSLGGSVMESAGRRGRFERALGPNPVTPASAIVEEATVQEMALRRAQRLAGDPLVYQQFMAQQPQMLPGQRTYGAPAQVNPSQQEIAQLLAGLGQQEIF